MARRKSLGAGHVISGVMTHFVVIGDVTVEFPRARTH